MRCLRLRWWWLCARWVVADSLNRTEWMKACVAEAIVLKALMRMRGKV